MRRDKTDEWEKHKDALKRPEPRKVPALYEKNAQIERLIRERDEALAREKEAQRLLEEYDFLTEEGGGDSLGAAMRKARAKALEEAAAVAREYDLVIDGQPSQVGQLIADEILALREKPDSPGGEYSIPTDHQFVRFIETPKE
jgi:hypothetical protein